MNFTISGTPEVDVNVTVKIEDTSKDVWLAWGTYPDRTTSALRDTFTTTVEKYYPLVYTLKNGKKVLATGHLSDIQYYLANNFDGLRFNAGDPLDLGDLSLTWEWPFEQGTDKQDTLLGDIAAFRNGNSVWFENDGEDGSSTSLVQDTHYNIDTNVKITVTVTQID